MRAKRADGGVEPRLCYLPSTPQSIAKPSPGWNKVALLTAVRNSPCSCPFSVSLHPPLAALNSEPRPGSLLAFCNHHPKAVPVCGGFEPHAVAPFGALYKLIHKQQRGRIASPYLHNLLCSPAARRISHCASNISLRISAISPVRKNGFHRGRKPAYLTLLAWTTKREPSSSSVQVVRVSTWSAWPMDMASDTLELGAVRA